MDEVDFEVQLQPLSAAQVLARLEQFKRLPHEDDPAWDDEHNQAWVDIEEFRALAHAIYERKLRQAIPQLLDRVCSGEPGEMLRSFMPDYLWAIANPDLNYLVDCYLAASRSEHTGARMWALEGLGSIRCFPEAFPTACDPNRLALIDAALESGLQDADRIARRTANTWFNKIRETRWKT